MARKQIASSTWKPVSPPAILYKRKNLKELLKTSEFIYQIGEYDALRKKSYKVSHEMITSDEMKSKIAYLKKCLLRFRKLTGKGRGIAAVQIGIPERFFALYDLSRKGKCLVMINPRITNKAKKKYRYPEQCMSCNNLVAPVIRPAWVEVAYFDEGGKRQYWLHKEKMENRVLQHEIDHLDGIINIDRVKSKELIFASDPLIHEKATFEEA